MRRDDDIFRHFLDATAPLLLWALHFFAAYAFAAVACDSGLAKMIWAGQSAILLVLAVATAAAFLMLLLLVARAVQLCRITPWQLLSGARLGLAVLALLGLAWVAVPLFVLPVCVE